jgi:hypothetical protein
VYRSSHKPSKGRGALIVTDSDSDSDVINDSRIVKKNTKLNTKKNNFSTKKDELNTKNKQVNDKINANKNTKNVNCSDSDSDIEIVYDRRIKKGEKKNKNFKGNAFS